MSYNPTAEQQAAIDGFRTGENMTIEAGAGTGKTSTLRFLADEAGDRNGLYIAFNKSVQLEAERKFAGTRIQAKTAHSLAFRSLPDELRWKLGDKRFMRDAEQMEILGLHTGLRVGGGGTGVSLPVSKRVAMRLVRETLAMFCRSAAISIEPSMVPVPPALGLTTRQSDDLQKQVARYAKKFWLNILDPDGGLPFQHDYYVKMWQLSYPTLPYDFILLDEAQDSDPLLIDVLHNQVNTQVIAVGDRSQAIYGWRGAKDSMDAFGGATFQLTQSFRFGAAIADEANQWLDLLNATLRVSGTDKESSVAASYNRVPEGVLCRTNSGAISEVIDAHQRADNNGDPVTVGIAGQNRAQQMKKLAQAALDLQEKGWTTQPELDTFKSWEEVQDFSQEDDGAELAPLVNVVDQWGADKIVAAIDACVPADQARTVISTVHVAKGLEWHHVRIAEDFPIPSLDEETGGLEKMTSEAMMLAYVAVTRAKRHLDPAGLDWVRSYKRALARPEYAATFSRNAQSHRAAEKMKREETHSNPNAIDELKTTKRRSSGDSWQGGGSRSWAGRRAS